MVKRMDRAGEQTDLAARAAEIVRPAVEGLGFELVETTFRRERQGWVLRLVIFRPEGVGVEDCARVSREAGYLLEGDDPLPGSYHLEVSSPGLDRPLRSAADFRRYPGHLVRIVLADEPEPLVGRIGAADEEAVEIDTGGETARIAYAAMLKARLEIEF